MTCSSGSPRPANFAGIVTAELGVKTLDTSSAEELPVILGSLEMDAHPYSLIGRFEGLPFFHTRLGGQRQSYQDTQVRQLRLRTLRGPLDPCYT
jgi:hypothetical protein